MSYLGNDPNQDINSFIIGVDKFNGTGACTQFQLTRDIDDAKAIEVIVNGVQQEPDASYTVTNGLMTFDEAPSSGSNNILVTYRAPIVVTYNSVDSTQLLPASVTESKIAPIAVTETKIGAGAVTGLKIGTGAVSGNNLTDTSIRANNIVVGQITGNLIAAGAVSGNQIGLYAVSGNQIGSGAVSGNNIVDNSIRANNIVAGQITGNLIAAGAVSGNQIGTGAISANNFAGGGITSNVLASNLSISTVRVAETLNVVTTAISGNYNIHVGNSTSYYFVSNTTGSVTFNLIANTGGNLNDLLSIGQTASVAIALKQGSTRYRANVHIDSVNPLSSVVWLGASQPALQAAQSQSIDTYTFTVMKIGQTTTGSGGGLYTVFAANATFASANGQGMGPGGVQ